MASSQLQITVVREMDRLFGSHFVRENCRPKWLLSDDGTRLELDVFIPRASVAIEVQGMQHYEFSPRFHATPEHFIAQQARDAAKRAICARKGIRLWEISSEGQIPEMLDEIRSFIPPVGGELLRQARAAYVACVVREHSQRYKKLHTRYLNMCAARDRGDKYRGAIVHDYKTRHLLGKLGRLAKGIRNVSNEAWADALKIKDINDPRLLNPLENHSKRIAVYKERRQKRLAERGPVPPPPPKAERPKRRRRGHRGKGTASPGDLSQNHAYIATTRRLVLLRESPPRKRDAKQRVAVPDGENRWIVSGGYCSHIVLLKDGRLECQDHEPEHPRPVQGAACCHEVAVRRLITAEIMRGEVAA